MAVNFTTNANQASGQDKILSFQYRSMTNLSIANDGQVLKVREVDEYNTPAFTWSTSWPWLPSCCPL